MNRKYTVPLSLLIASSLLASVILTVPSAYAEDSTISNNTLNTLTTNKANLENNVEQRKDNKEQLKQTINQLNSQISDTEKQLFALQTSIDKTQSSINDTKIEINKYIGEINELEKTINEKSKLLNEQQKLLEEHLKLMYSGGGKVKLLEILFRSENVSEFINRFDYYKEITKKGEKLQQEVSDSIDEINKKKEKLELSKQTLSIKKLKFESDKAEIEAKHAEQEQLKSQLSANKKDASEDLQSQDKAMDSLASQIAEAEKAITAEQNRIIEEKRKQELAKLEAAKAAEKSNSNTSDNTSSSSETIISANSGSSTARIGLPVPKGTYYITSRYGYRTDPVYGNKAFHSGVDFAAPYNTPILAVEDGYVLFSGPATGFGNWVVIKHDNGLYSIYGHMYSNQIKVKNGQRVTRGQQIADSRKCR